MPDKLLKAGICTSDRIGAVSEFAELLFVRLIVATCHAGRCPWDPDWIRTHALPNRRRKRLTEIAVALESLRRAHLVTRYTGPDGTAYLLIPNHGQRLRHAVRSPWPSPPAGPPDAEGQTFMALPGAAPPPPAEITKPKARESCATHFTSLPLSSEEGVKGEGDLRLASDCLDELADAWPHHDLRACLREARRYVRRQRGEDADVTVDWFTRHWLPKAPKRRDAVAAAVSGAEPAGWREALETLYPGNAINAEARAWATVPAEVAARVRAQLASPRAA